MTLSDEVVQAFGAVGEPQRLVGGEGNSYLVGDLVFKPTLSETETIWRSELLSTISQNGFRVAEPRKTREGRWTYGGWEAAAFLEGKEEKGRWKEKIAVSRIFHSALKDVEKPRFIEKASHPWAVADRMVWGEQKLEYGQRLSVVMGQLMEMVKPISLPHQLIHGDMTGNILFQDNLVPAIIDLSPYWRPAEFATAVIIVDSIVWEGADESLLSEMDNTVVSNQLLVRSALWRIKTTEEYIKQYNKGSISDVDSYTPCIEMLKKRVYK
jgi:uncharacterized protein (TIGR02569 family)